MNRKPIDHTDADQLLDAVIRDIRNQPIPPHPTIGEKVHPRSAARGKGAVRNRVLSIGLPVLATTAAMLAIGVFVLLPATSSTAFAQVQEALMKVQTLRYTVLDHHDNWLGTPKTFESRAIIVEPHWTRSESDHNGVTISDLQRERRLSIKHDSKTATFYKIETTVESLAKRLEFLDLFRNVPAHATKRLGKTKFNGVLAEQFSMEFGGRNFLVTIDSKTKLPLHMEYHREGFREVFTDFVFDEPVDMNLFALEAPEGYTVIEYQLDDPPAFASSIVVSPKFGIDDLDFGCSIEEVMGHLGEPSDRKDDKITDFNGSVHSSTTLSYNSLGLTLFFNSEGLSSLNCQSRRRTGQTVHSFAGCTGAGLSMGDERDKVIEAYGKPDFENSEKIDYVRLGISFYLQDAAVAGIDITQPLDPILEFEIDPQSGARRIWVRNTED